MAAAEKPWYSRPVFFVEDVEGALAFYIERLAFSECWRHEEDGAVLVAQVERSGFEIILNHSTDRAGKSRAFMSLDRGQVREAMADFESRGAQVSTGHWGMPVMYVVDPEGNELYFYDDALKSEDGEAAPA